MHMLRNNKLGALSLLLNDAIENAFAEHSLSGAGLLLTLHYQGPMTATALAAVGGIAQPTAARVTDRLIRHGFVQRGPQNGRTAPLRLTRAGKRQALALQRLRLRAMNQFMEALSENDGVQFERAVDKILSHATKSRAFARTTCRLCDHSVCSGRLCPPGSKATALERQLKSTDKRNR
jgi:DNA-binding MarR family transcriptional regulator